MTDKLEHRLELAEDGALPYAVIEIVAYYDSEGGDWRSYVVQGDISKGDALRLLEQTKLDVYFAEISGND